MKLFQLFRNRPVRRIFAVLIVITTLILTIGIIIMRQQADSIVQNLIEKDVALAGGVSLGKPPASLCVLTNTIEPEDYQAGIKLLGDYSYLEANPENYPYYQWLIDSRIKEFVLWVGIFFVAASLLLLTSFSVVYQSFQKLTQTAQCIARGEIPQLDSGGEGEEQAVQYAFSAMAQRLQYNTESLKRDKEYLKNFLSDVSHQLKTPLAALRMYNEILLSKKDIDPQKHQEFLQRSKEQIDRTDWLIQGLLKSARIDAGAVRMDLRECYLIDTVQNALAPFEEHAKRRGICLESRIDSDILLCHDSRWVTEAVGNIVKNALEHTPDGGNVQVFAENTPITITLSIADNGRGMESTEIPLIFERFYRNGGETSPTNVGIGLSLARQILELNHADIYVKSAPGQGSTFLITFLKKT